MIWLALLALACTFPFIAIKLLFRMTCASVLLFGMFWLVMNVFGERPQQAKVNHQPSGQYYH